MHKMFSKIKQYRYYNQSKQEFQTSTCTFPQEMIACSKCETTSGCTV